MDLINEISKMVMMLIRAGAVFRVSYSFFRMITADEDSAMYRKRVKNTLVFYVIAESAFVIKNLILEYYA